MIRVLLVEDNPEDAQAAQEVLMELPGGSPPTTVRDRESAIAAIDAGFFDLIVLDLKIPPNANSDDREPENGLAVFSHAKRVAPGTPLFLLTGSSVEAFVPTLLEHAERIDIWGGGAAGRVQTVSVLPKLDFDQFGNRLLPYLQGVENLAIVELDRGGIDLSIEEERLIRICACRFRGVRCEVSSIGGGLSGVKVLRLRIRNAQGGTIQTCIGKIGSIADIRDESSRYQDHIVHLVPDATPRQIATLEFGGKDRAAVFYGLAAGRDLNFFQFIQAAEACVGAAFVGVQNGLRGWRDAATQGMRAISEVRRRMLSDDTREAVLARHPLDWSDRFEALQVPVKWGCVHGDFHGGNVLLSAAGEPAIIDYGDVGDGPMSLDPIALEFSLFFHPDGPCKQGAWPTPEQAENWGDLEHYLVGCPYPEFVRYCREWSIEMAAGSRERAAVAYAYLLRQLKYADTNAELALCLVQGAKNLYDST